MANLVSQVYNWCKLYVRFFDEQHRCEAISRSSAVMQCIGQ